jgi:hypothetical protein
VPKLADVKPATVCAAGPADADTRGDWVAQLSRLQLLAAKWLAADPQQLLQEAYAAHWDEHEQFALGVSDLHDQVCGDCQTTSGTITQASLLSRAA